MKTHIYYKKTDVTHITPPPEEEVAAIDFLWKLPLVCQVSLQAEDDLKLPDLLKISPNILSYPLADCCEFYL